MKTKSIKKKLTKNDTGASGSHQAGLHFPKGDEYQSFFPSLNTEALNPRINITFADENDLEWDFNYIYYNNKYVKNSAGNFGTRNEYRLTCMTKYFRNKNLKPNDSIIFSKDFEGNFNITFNRSDAFENVENEPIWEVTFL